MIIAKFGGTSVASAERIRTILGIVQSQLHRRPVIVVSAVSGVTDTLLSLAQVSESQVETAIEGIRQVHERLVNDLFSQEDTRLRVMDYIDEKLREIKSTALKRNLTLEDRDELVSYGETMSSFIIAAFFNSQGIKAKQVIASELIVTDGNFTQAEFLPSETEEKTQRIITPLVEEGIVPVVTGFMGATKEGKITTLGRGGSDYSASILGFALDAEEIQIWTDVDGVYSADPRVVKSARLIPEISYREASEMAAFGAKVLHPRTIRPAIQKNIPIRVLNTFNPDAAGTFITGENVTQGLKAVSFKRRTTLVNIYSATMLFSKGFLAKIFEVFSRENISIDLVSVSEVSVSVTLDNDQNLLQAIKELEGFTNVSVSHDFGMISLIGEGLMSSQDVLREVSELFHSNKMPIRMVSLGASDINISLVLNAQDIEKAANLVHDQLLLRRGIN